MLGGEKNNTNEIEVRKMTIGEKTLCVGGSRPDLITDITIVGLDSYTVCKVFVTCLATTL